MLNTNQMTPFEINVALAEIIIDSVKPKINKIDKAIRDENSNYEQTVKIVLFMSPINRVVDTLLKNASHRDNLNSAITQLNDIASDYANRAQSDAVVSSTQVQLFNDAAEVIQTTAKLLTDTRNRITPQSII